MSKKSRRDFLKWYNSPAPSGKGKRASKRARSELFPVILPPRLPLKLRDTHEVRRVEVREGLTATVTLRKEAEE